MRTSKERVNNEKNKNQPTYVIDSTRAKFAKKVFSSQRLEVMNEECPKVKDVVPGEPISFVHYCNLTA